MILQARSKTLNGQSTEFESTCPALLVVLGPQIVLEISWKKVSINFSELRKIALISVVSLIFCLLSYFFFYFLFVFCLFFFCLNWICNTKKSVLSSGWQYNKRGLVFLRGSVPRQSTGKLWSMSGVISVSSSAESYRLIVHTNKTRDVLRSKIENSIELEATLSINWNMNPILIFLFVEFFLIKGMLFKHTSAFVGCARRWKARLSH